MTLLESDRLDGLLAELVAIDSVNPSLVPGAAGESEIRLRFVAAWLAQRGLDVELENVGGGSGQCGRPCPWLRRRPLAPPERASRHGGGWRNRCRSVSAGRGREAVRPRRPGHEGRARSGHVRGGRSRRAGAGRRPHRDSGRRRGSRKHRLGTDRRDAHGRRRDRDRADRYAAGSRSPRIRVAGARDARACRARLTVRPRRRRDRTDGTGARRHRGARPQPALPTEESPAAPLRVRPCLADRGRDRPRDLPRALPVEGRTADTARRERVLGRGRASRGRSQRDGENVDGSRSARDTLELTHRPGCSRAVPAKSWAGGSSRSECPTGRTPRSLRPLASRQSSSALAAKEHTPRSSGSTSSTSNVRPRYSR